MRTGTQLQFAPDAMGNFAIVVEDQADRELIAAYVPEADSLSYEEALELAQERDDEAAAQLEMDREREV